MMQGEYHFCTPTSPLLTGDNPLRAGSRIFRAIGLRDWMMHYTLSGQAEFRHAEGRILCEAGDLVLVKLNFRQEYGTIGPQNWEIYWAVFAPLPTWSPWLE